MDTGYGVGSGGFGHELGALLLAVVLVESIEQDHGREDYELGGMEDSADRGRRAKTAGEEEGCGYATRSQQQWPPYTVGASRADPRPAFPSALF